MTLKLVLKVGKFISLVSSLKLIGTVDGSGGKTYSGQGGF